MTIRTAAWLFAVCGAAAALAGCAAAKPEAAAATPFPDPPTATEALGSNAVSPAASGPQTVVLAGGCFWGVQGVLERLKGVSDTEAGYSGGSADTASYEIVSTGQTGHAESVRLTYDPSVISFGTILKVFFSVVMDPTELDYQGPDHGTQYRSVIFYTSDAQRAVAEDYTKILENDKIYGDKPIVTQITPLVAFYPAEEYHQHFLDKNPSYPYIAFWDLPKIRALDARYPDLVTKQS